MDAQSFERKFQDKGVPYFTRIANWWRNTTAGQNLARLFKKMGEEAPTHKKR